MDLKNTFKGPGPMVEFAEESNKLFSAINNAVVLMPKGYKGATPRLYVDDDGRLVLDMADAAVFSPKNISVSVISGTAVISSLKKYFSNGNLQIQIVAS